MVKVGNQGLDDRYIRLRSHRISHPHVVSGLRQSFDHVFETRVFDQVSTFGFVLRRSYGTKQGHKSLRMRPTSLWKFYKLRDSFGNSLTKISF